MVKLPWSNGNRQQRELRSKQFVELSAILFALLTKQRHGEQKAPNTYLNTQAKGNEPAIPV